MTDTTLVTLTPEPFAYVTRECALEAIGKTIEESFCTLDAALGQAKVAPSGPPLARYTHFADGRVTVDLGFPVHAGGTASLRAAGLNTGMTGGGLAMRGVHVGPYDTLRQTYDKILTAIRAAGRAPADEMWERYFAHAEAASEARTEVLWPVKPAMASYE